MAKMGELIGTVARAAREVAAEAVWPSRCAVCDAPGDLICERCARSLAVADACLACPTCGSPYGRLQCTECNALMVAALGRDAIPYEGMAFALVADAACRRIVKAYKDKGERRLGPLIAAAMARCVSPDRVREGYAVTFIPATRAAVRRRGFDHAEELAGLIAGRLGLDRLKLMEPPRTADQRALTRQQRAENMRGAIRVAAGAPIPERLIVIDDICTTGATLYAAGDALAAAGAEHLCAVAFGRVLD